MYKYIVLILIILLTGTAVVFMWFPNSQEEEKKIGEPSDRIVKIKIEDGSTYGELMTTANIPAQTANQIYENSLELYDLAKVRVGRSLELVYDHETNEFKQFIYKIDTEDELVVSLFRPEPVVANPEVITDPAEVMIVINEPEWRAEIRPIQYEVKIKTAGGNVVSSMYQSALDNNIDERAIIELANAFQWTIDFAMDTRVGDSYKFIYEERYLNGEYIMPGKVLAGRYKNVDDVYYVFYFEETEDNQGFFDQEGNSVQKMFLKAPVEFRYISSGFSYGPRYVGGNYQLFTANHMAIDYAAASGTPIRAVGDGTVVSAGWNNQGYGYLTSIHHNGTYTTNYAHQSRIIVKYGQKVKQGEVIGYVGSTGFSTGPHLHFEMVKNGSKVNPSKEILPPGEPIKEENRARFFTEMENYKKQLDIE
ncbi:MAG: peptidoglycan DD-metalloendopeptidase family protein [bacterium]